MVDPEGNCYERAAIERWLSTNSTSPVTRSPLRIHQLYPNRALKQLILAACPEIAAVSVQDGGVTAVVRCCAPSWSRTLADARFRHSCSVWERVWSGFAAGNDGSDTSCPFVVCRCNLMPRSARRPVPVACCSLAPPSMSPWG